jgi:hypothetical protein
MRAVTAADHNLFAEGSQRPLQLSTIGASRPHGREEVEMLGHCGTCGAPQVPDGAYCASCGSQFPDLVLPGAPEVSTQEPDRTLEVVAPPEGVDLVGPPPTARGAAVSPPALATYPPADMPAPPVEPVPPPRPVPRPLLPARATLYRLLVVALVAGIIGATAYGYSAWQQLDDTRTELEATRGELRVESEARRAADSEAARLSAQAQAQEACIAALRRTVATFGSIYEKDTVRYDRIAAGSELEEARVAQIRALLEAMDHFVEAYVYAVGDNFRSASASMEEGNSALERAIEQAKIYNAEILEIGAITAEIEREVPALEVSLEEALALCGPAAGSP